MIPLQLGLQGRDNGLSSNVVTKPIKVVAGLGKTAMKNEYVRTRFCNNLELVLLKCFCKLDIYCREDRQNIYVYLSPNI